MRTALIAALLIAGVAQADEAPKLEKTVDLPVVADELRNDGVPDKDVKDALKAAKDKKLKGDEATEVLEDADKAIKEHGPIDNFGAFVGEQLESGLRGKELAAAIKAEHAARGKGKPEGKGKPDDKGGKPDDKGGKPDDKGGKPDDKGGKPADKGGKPADKGGKPDGKAGGAH